METAILLQNPHWDDRSYSNLMKRSILEKLINKLSLKEIQVLLGVRRSGKSTLFQLLINHLMVQVDPKSILYINFDDPYYADIWQDAKLLYKVIETAEKLTGIKPIYLLLDEIQNVDGWERFVKSNYDSNQFKKIFITGSNSSLLKGNYARLLSGRYVKDYVYPLSYKEILLDADIKNPLELYNNKIKAIKLVEDMLLYGSFPEIFGISDLQLKREVLLTYYETIVLKDCVFNYQVRETKTLRKLALYMLTNCSTLYSYNSLAKNLESNDNTVKEFIHILENGFLIDEIKNFSYSLKTQTRSKKKSYCVDNGLLQAVVLRFSEDKGKLFENLVFTELKKSNQYKIYFSNDEKECDFIINKDKKMTAIQVAFEINTMNREREINGLTTAMKKFKIDKGYIITFDQKESLDDEKEIIPFWELFFDFN